MIVSLSSVKPVLLNILIGILCCYTIWWILSPQQDRITQTSLSSIHPDAIMQQVQIALFDERGNPLLMIHAPRMMHFTQQDQTQFLFPAITIYTQKISSNAETSAQSPWYLTAYKATLLHGMQKIDLQEQVHLHHIDDFTSTTADTTTLTLYPKQKTAETTARITLRQPDLFIQGVGMKANLATGDIQLLSHIQGEYLPH